MSSLADLCIAADGSSWSFVRPGALARGEHGGHKRAPAKCRNPPDEDSYPPRICPATRDKLVPCYLVSARGRLAQGSGSLRFRLGDLRQTLINERPENRLIGKMRFASNRFGEPKLTGIQAQANGLGPFVARFEIRQE